MVVPSSLSSLLTTRCPWSRAIGAARGRAVTLTVQEPTACDPAPLHPDNTGSKWSMALQHSPGAPWSRASRRQGDPDKTIPGNRNFRALGAGIRCLLSRRRIALRVSLSSGAAPLVVAPRRPRYPPYMARATRRLLWHQSYGTNLFMYVLTQLAKDFIRLSRFRFVAPGRRPGHRGFRHAGRQRSGVILLNICGFCRLIRWISRQNCRHNHMLGRSLPHGRHNTDLPR